MQVEYIERLKNIGLRVTDPSLSSNDKQYLHCLLCSKQFNATPKSKINNSKKSKHIGCPSCVKISQHKQSRIDNYNILSVKFNVLHDIEEFIKFDGYEKINVTNKKCGHTFLTELSNLISKEVNCRICNDLKKSNKCKIFNNEKHLQSLKNKSLFKQYSIKVNIITNKNYIRYKNIINPKNLPRRLAKTNDDGYQLDHIISKKYCFMNNIPPEICGHQNNLEIVSRIYNSMKYSKIIPKFPAIFEPFIPIINKLKIFKNSLANIDNAFTFDNDTIDAPNVLTAVHENKKIIIHYLGLRENSFQVTKNKKGLIELHNRLSKMGYRSIFVFEDEYDKNSNMIISKISHILGNSSLVKIFARKCSIKEISNNIKRDFLNDNHIQGNSISKINLGAYYEEKLVAVMTFYSPKYGKYPDNTYELTRFATNINYKLPGIASKLLNHFKQNFVHNIIFSYADLRWSDGNLYEKLGFKFSHDCKPNYFYIVANERKHRFGYRKNILKDRLSTYDENLTEYVNMINNGIDCVYDCGSKKYIMENNT